MGVGTRRCWVRTIAGGRWLGKAEPKNERYFSTRLLVASHADGLMLYRITLHNSPNFHVGVNRDEWVYGVGRAPDDSDG